MKTYPIRDNATDRLVAFEISEVAASHSRIAKLLRGVDGVAGVEVRKLFSRLPSDIHVRFEYRGTKCVVWEWYGDNSRYWIGPDADDSPEEGPDLSVVEKAFREHEPPLLRRLLEAILPH